MASPEAFSGLFWTAFRRSRNAMLLLDDQRGIVDVNPAFLGLLGYTREQLVGRPIRDFVVGGPILTPEEWEARMSLGDFTGEGELLASDGTEGSVQLAAHTEGGTGRRLGLFVTLSTSRWGRHFRRDTRPIEPSETLSPRELDVVRLIAMGGTGREIAHELHISPDTVRTHVRNAMRKVGARSRAQLVAKVLAE